MTVAEVTMLVTHEPCAAVSFNQRHLYVSMFQSLAVIEKLTVH